MRLSSFCMKILILFNFFPMLLAAPSVMAFHSEFIIMTTSLLLSSHHRHRHSAAIIKLLNFMEMKVFPPKNSSTNFDNFMTTFSVHPKLRGYIFLYIKKKLTREKNGIVWNNEMVFSLPVIVADA